MNYNSSPGRLTEESWMSGFKWDQSTHNLHAGYSYIKVDQYRQETAFRITIIVITTKIDARGKRREE